MKSDLQDIGTDWQLTDRFHRLLILSWVSLIVIPNLGIFILGWSAAKVLAMLVVDLVSSALSDMLMLVLARDAVEQQTEEKERSLLSHQFMKVLVHAPAHRSLLISKSIDKPRRATKAWLSGLYYSLPVVVIGSYALFTVGHSREFLVLAALVFGAHVLESIIKALKVRTQDRPTLLVLPSTPDTLGLALILGVFFLGIGAILHRLDVNPSVGLAYALALAAAAMLISWVQRSTPVSRQVNHRLFLKKPLSHWIKRVGGDPAKLGLSENEI